MKLKPDYLWTPPQSVVMEQLKVGVAWGRELAVPWRHTQHLASKSGRTVQRGKSAGPSAAGHKVYEHRQFTSCSLPSAVIYKPAIKRASHWVAEDAE